MFPPSQVVPQIIVAHTAWSNLIPSMSWKVTFKMPGNCQRSLYYQTQQYLNNENFIKLPFWLLISLKIASLTLPSISFAVCACAFNRVPLHLPNSQRFFLTASLVKNTCVWCIFVGKSKPKKNQTFTWVVLKKMLQSMVGYQRWCLGQSCS